MSRPISSSASAATRQERSPCADATRQRNSLVQRRQHGPADGPERGEQQPAAKQVECKDHPLDEVRGLGRQGREPLGVVQHRGQFGAGLGREGGRDVLARRPRDLVAQPPEIFHVLVRQVDHAAKAHDPEHQLLHREQLEFHMSCGSERVVDPLQHHGPGHGRCARP
jgi:hypothetical protein